VRPPREQQLLFPHCHQLMGHAIRAQWGVCRMLAWRRDPRRALLLVGTARRAVRLTPPVSSAFGRAALPRGCRESLVGSRCRVTASYIVGLPALGEPPLRPCRNGGPRSVVAASHRPGRRAYRFPFPPSPPPQRHRGFSPLRKQIAMSTTIRTASDAIQSPICRGSSRNAAPESSPTQTTITTHPCHAHGGPQPQPYRLAGNQIRFSFSRITDVPSDSRRRTAER
jgi:hypothetical protein